MNRPFVSYSMQIAAAVLGNDIEKANMIAATAIGNVTQEAINIANSLESADLPFVYVGFRSVCDTLYNVMNEEGKQCADSLLKRTVSVTVNEDAIKKMYGKDRDKEQ